jgi:transposase-like protein
MSEPLLPREVRRRLAIIQHAEEVTGNVAMTCRYYGIIRTVYYRWLGRYREQGVDGLRDRLIDVLLHGGADEARIAELRALAEAEAMPTNPALMSIVQGSVRVELCDLYAPVAAAGYDAVAKVFDDTAAKFTTCAGKVDVEADSEAVVALPAAARSAWIDAIGHAAALDEHLPVLVAAAELAGTIVDTDTLLLPLIVRNTDTLHRRRLWQAFGSADLVAAHKNWVSKREIAHEWAPPLGSVVRGARDDRGRRPGRAHPAG